MWIKLGFFSLCSEVLPVVEFEIASDITDEEAIGLIGSRPSHSAKSHKLKSKVGDNAGGKWREEIQTDSNVQVLQFNEDNDEEEEFGTSLTDPFSKAGQVGGAASGDRLDFNKVVLGKAELRSLDPTEVIVCKWPPPLRYKFHKNLMPEVMSISTCHKCFKVKWHFWGTTSLIYF